MVAVAGSGVSGASGASGRALHRCGRCGSGGRKMTDAGEDWGIGLRGQLDG